MILVLVWRRRNVIEHLVSHEIRPAWILMVVGLLSGFYDGFFGPGGGTVMLLGLIWGARLSLFEALLLSKLANTLSAGVSLVSYAGQGYVHPEVGMWMAFGSLTGAFFGAKLVSKRAEKIVKPVLTLVVLLLMGQQIYEVL